MSVMFGSRRIEIQKGQGAEVYDTSGKHYIDFVCGHGSSLFGHNHPKLVKVLKESSEYPWSIGVGFESRDRRMFMERLREILPGGKVFLCNSGTESIEAALKLVSVFRPERKGIVALRRSFHGRTLGALSLTFNPRYRSTWKDMLQEVVHVTPEQIPRVVDKSTAAVFVEPVQGEGGIHVMDKRSAGMINDSCRKNGVILVSDEIQSGWGRCGSLLGSSMTGLKPDMVCLAKGVAGGLPVGATIWKGELGDFPVMGHGTTYGGNPLVSSVGLAALELLHSEKYPEHALKMGEYFRGLLSGISSPLIKEVRGLGLLTGVELAVKASSVIRKLEEKGILALSAGPMVVRFLPPLVVKKDQLDQVVSVMEEILGELSE